MEVNIRNIILYTSLHFLLMLSNHITMAQSIYPLSPGDSSQTQQVNDDSITSHRADESFDNFYSSKTTNLHSIAIGAGEKLSFWYYFMAPLIRLERIKFASFGLGFGGKSV